MVLTEENKKNIINSILKLVDKVSDKEYQIRAWIRASGPDCYPYDELINDFFQLCDPTLKEYKDFHISKNQYESLKTFRDELDNFIDLPIAFDTNDFSDTQEWAKVIVKAKEVLKETKPMNLCWILSLLSEVFNWLKMVLGMDRLSGNDLV